MLRKTFTGGIHPACRKDLSKDLPIKTLALPSEVILPLAQHIGAPCKPIVKVGDRVKTGDVIAQSEKFVTAPIHASVSGLVKAIKKFNHPVLGFGDAIVINSDQKDEKAFGPGPGNDAVFGLSAEAIKERIMSAGIVGLGGAAFPTHVKLSPPKDKKISTFILNGAECEPYLTCDDRLMREFSCQIFAGMLLLMRSVGVLRGIIAIEGNKPKAIEAMKKAVDNFSFPDGARYDISVACVPVKYPQGGEKQLIKTLTGRSVPAAKLPFDVGCLVDNVATAYAAYEAVCENKPLLERVITITGDAINEPANCLVRIGTPVLSIIEACGGIKGKLAKLIVGGPMMGLAQYSANIPVVKGTSGILLLGGGQHIRTENPQYCIRCGRCQESCPAKLIPTDIARASELGRFEAARELNAIDCIECGCCSYVCPSHIPLVQLIRYAKKVITCMS
ncbi:MAG: electron transport complex subunit RsxC [Candidatus Omnitrophica bacterium]|nr:electron transport complex subunit RsxC [Candidatus Omnitrophota bacterium]